MLRNLYMNKYDWYSLEPLGNKQTYKDLVQDLTFLIFEDIGEALLQEKFNSKISRVGYPIAKIDWKIKSPTFGKTI